VEQVAVGPDSLELALNGVEHQVVVVLLILRFLVRGVVPFLGEPLEAPVAE
jgi:hypothetical protein